MMRAALVWVLLLALLVATAVYLREPITVDITGVGKWRIPVGPPFEAVPPARP